MENLLAYFVPYGFSETKIAAVAYS